MTKNNNKKTIINSFLAACVTAVMLSAPAHAAPRYETSFESETPSKRWESVGREGKLTKEIGGREGEQSYKFTVGTNASKITLKKLKEASVATSSALEPVNVRSAMNLEDEVSWMGFSVFVPHKFVADSRSEDIFFKLESNKRLPNEAFPMSMGIQGSTFTLNITGGSRGEVVTGYKKRENPPVINRKNKKIYDMIAGSKGQQKLFYETEKEIKYISRDRFALGKVEAGKWHDFVIYMKPGYNRDSFIYVYLNGKEAAKYTGAIALQKDDDMFVQMGLWRNKWNDKDTYIKDARRGMVTRSLYIDTFRTASGARQYSDVMPGRGVQNGSKEFVLLYRPDGKVPELRNEPVTREFIEAYFPQNAIDQLEKEGLMPPASASASKPEGESNVDGFINNVKTLFRR